MTFTCDRCQRRYSIGDDKVRGRTVKIRCKNCQNVITVEGPAAEESTKMMTITEVEQLRQKQHVPAGQSLWENEATKATPALDMSVQWHAMIQGQQSGPFNIATLGGKVSSGEVTLRTYVWRKGMPDWKRASDLPEMAILFAGGNVAKSPVAPAPVSRRPTGAMPAITAAQPQGTKPSQQFVCRAGSLDSVREGGPILEQFLHRSKEFDRHSRR